MRPTPSYVYLVVFTLLQLANGARKPESVLLSNVKSLTLRKDLQTTNNRVAAVPQLNCIGGNAKGLYEVDIMRCKNQGSDYDAENVQWTCSASLPVEFKLGSTDVICEGFASSQDPYVLKGSCGVEYRLLLTELGEEKYGGGGPGLWKNYKGEGYVNWPAIIFWGLFISVLVWMIYAAFIRDSLNGTTLGGGRNNPWGWGGGGGGGGSGGGGGGGAHPDHYDPPPPYDYGSSKKPSARTPGQEGWRPGFWTGAGLGGAAGYLASNRRQTQQPRNTGLFGTNGEPGGGFWGNTGNRYNDNGEGNSGWGRTVPSSSTSASPSFSSTRHESSGFGSTSRR